MEDLPKYAFHKVDNLPEYEAPFRPDTGHDYHRRIFVAIAFLVFVVIMLCWILGRCKILAC